MSRIEPYKPITEIAHDAIHDDTFQGPRMFYAWDGAEDSTTWVGPCASVAEALCDYLDEHGPEDDDHIDVSLGKAVTPPRFGFDAHDLLDRTCDDDWPEGAVDIMAGAVAARGKRLEEAVEALVRSWCEEHVRLGGYWKGYGRSLETTAGEARRWLAERHTIPVEVIDLGERGAKGKEVGRG